MAKKPDDSAEKKTKLKNLAAQLPRKFEIALTPEFKEQLKAIENDTSKPGLIWQAKAAIIKLAHDPMYSGLNSHSFASLSKKYGEDIQESYVQNKTPGACRLFWYFTSDKKKIVLVLITPHP